MKNHKLFTLSGTTLIPLLIATLLLSTVAQADTVKETVTTITSITPSTTITNTIADVVEPDFYLTRNPNEVNTPLSAETGPIFVYPQAVLWDNGPLVTHPGSGYNGADASALQTASGMLTYGLGNQFPVPHRLADDFEITNPNGWQIETITFFAYQTDSPTQPSPITGVYYQIWNGPPNNTASSVVWGNLTTNRLINSTWSNIYRTSDTNLLANNRPIMANKASAGVTLPPGDYWLDWTTAGSLASGPWAPPITILGQTTTGNALHYTTSWASALDTGTNTPQGMPFIIEGTVNSTSSSAINLPLMFNLFPYTPLPPTLNSINNSDGDGNYTVSWSSSVGATTYTLQEDDNIAFSSPTTAYTGSNTSKAISGKDVGTYYYRVKASNTNASSNWSNIVSVTVTVPLPDCPQAGAWSGTTNQGRNISFTVENSPQCRIAAGSLRITIRDSCYYVTTTQFSGSYNITNNHFDTGGVSVRIIGDFTSLNAADGTFSLYMANPFPPPYNCTASGTWTADPSLSQGNE